ncbi:MAG: TonB-dependent receptor, partial [Methylocella sp.]
EYDSYVFNILALQTKGENYDAQLSFFNRYTSVHFVPDVYGDLVFNDVASNVSRESLLNGIQFDGSYRLNDVHTLRAGFAVSGEETQVNNTSTVLPLGPNGTPLPLPLTLTDYNSQLGWNLGGYIQDEWKITNNLTLNTGLRFDQLYQFVAANQFSPRVALIYKPFEDTSIHAGYARYFTPPMQAQATPTNLALFNNTTQQPVIAADDPVLPERSHYFDVGVDQKVLPGLTVGADAYYKIATDLIDDGQFGQAVVLTQFNYANGYSEGAEIKAKYQNDGFTAYANFSTNRTKAKDVVSNQYLFDDPVEFAYIANNYHFTDDCQLFTASAGASYKWDNTLVSLDGIYGSGLRQGFANLEQQQPYTQFNFAVSRDFNLWPNAKPLNVRFTVVNLLDTLYQLRSGTGIGEFAPQYGPHRGFFVTLSQKL